MSVYDTPILLTICFLILTQTISTFSTKKNEHIFVLFYLFSALYNKKKTTT